MEKTKSGYRVAVNNIVNGMFEQGGVYGRIVIVQWGAVPGLTPETTLTAHYNDLHDYEDMIRDCAYGRCGDQSKVRVLRKGTRIR